ncbi:MAG: putative DNA binding domain-containing protein [Bacteroidaceae bacterium]|nr:putative DNA binding domain-containing protein [Bacteroidaceae bacterium]
MTLDEIKELIKTDETRFVEMKKTTGELKDGMHSLCAMLNSDGGYVIFGIAPGSKKIIGQMVTDNTRKEIGREIRKLEPYVTYPRNKSIAQVLYLTAYLERWGTGVERIVQICKEYGVPEPEWTATTHDVTVTFWRKSKETESLNGENFGENKLTERQQLIYNTLKTNGENTAKSLARILGMSQRTVEREISILRNQGYIDKEGTKSGVWKVLK